jgi:hypothetical protein
MRSYRRLVAPISVALLIVVAVLAFLNLRPSYVGPPPILDPNLELWVGDQGAKRLMLWDLESIEGPGDNVSLQATVINGKSATEFLILQSGSSGNAVYAYLTQMMDGERLAGLLTGDLGVWILAEPCECNAGLTAQSVIFGVEMNDGVHTLTFIFSDTAVATTMILAHRLVYLPVQPGTWTYQHINVTREYALAQWSLPGQLSFSMVFWVGGHATGWHRAYVNSFHVTGPQLISGPGDSSGGTQPAFSSAILQSCNPSRSRFSYFVVKV